jgi:S-methylmethionine-dependent homocysteine/selenocysteine methylase
VTTSPTTSTATSTGTTSGTGPASRPTQLPHLTGPIFISDGGLETTLVFHEGLELPDFAAFPLLDTADGRDALERYFEPYFAVADRDGFGMLVDTPTWRANADWGPRLGYDRDALAAVNERAVEFVRGLAARWPGVTSVINGAIGPRGDGYVVEERMSAPESASYHALQARSFAAAGADMVTAVTMTYADEATGIVRAAVDADIDVAIGFTVETDGRLPSGETLGEAIATVDGATGSAALYYMINCAHPSHFSDVVRTDEPWLERIKAIRANASMASHEELDNAEELDRGDPVALANDYVALFETLPDLRLVGGCCGTDHDHVGAISARLRERVGTVAGR